MPVTPPSPEKGIIRSPGLATFLSGFVLLMLVPGVVAWHTGWLTAGFETVLVQHLQAWGPWMPLAFGVFKILTIVLAVPAAPVTFVGGVLFGPYWGTLINILSATVGACVCFILSRRLGRHHFEAIRGDRLEALDAVLTRQGFRTTVLLRLTPVIPFNVVNYSSGLTRVSFSHYFWGTLIGVCPGAAAYSWMGHGARAASWSLVAASVAILALVWLGAWFFQPRLTTLVSTSPATPDTANSESIQCPPPA